MDELTRAREFEKTHLSDISREERPVYHVTPAIGWMNDPNGFSYYKGEYHLFYQYYPYAAKWGPMHWGHYTTTDFVRWEFLPAALAPEEEYESGCFSGSAVETKDGKHLIMYTAHLEQEMEDGTTQAIETQCIATGNGVDYIKYDGNPVLTGQDLPEGGSISDFRDPKIWIENGKYYCVTVNRAKDQSGQVLLFSSEDGCQWSFEHVMDSCRNEYGEMWECPDFFRLGEKAVIMVSPMNMKNKGLEFHSGHNVIGLIGTCGIQDLEFTREYVQNVDYGFDFYASQTTESADGRRIMTAWMQCWASSNCQPPHAKWFSMLAFPRELTLRDGKLIQNPVRELKKYRQNPVIYRNYTIDKLCEPEEVSGRIVDVEITVKTNDSDCKEFVVYMAANEEVYTSFCCDMEKEIITVDRSNSGLRHDIVCQRKFKIRKKDGNVKLRFLADRFSIELFVNDGEQAFSMCIYDTPQDADRIRFFSDKPVEIDIEKYDIIV